MSGPEFGLDLLNQNLNDTFNTTIDLSILSDVGVRSICLNNLEYNMIIKSFLSTGLRFQKWTRTLL